MVAKRDLRTTHDHVTSFDQSRRSIVSRRGIIKQIPMLLMTYVYTYPFDVISRGINWQHHDSLKGFSPKTTGSEGVSCSNINLWAAIVVVILDSAADGMASKRMPDHQLLNPGWFRILRQIWKFETPPGAPENGGILCLNFSETPWWLPLMGWMHIWYFSYSRAFHYRSGF